MLKLFKKRADEITIGESIILSLILMVLTLPVTLAVTVLVDWVPWSDIEDWFKCTFARIKAVFTKD